MNKNVRHAVRVFAIKNGQIVCIKYKNINKDFFDIPGGKIEDGETAIEACIREFKEETGMDIDNVNFMGKVNVMYPAKTFELEVYSTNTIKGNPQEFSENYSGWMPITDLINQDKRLAITHLLDVDMKEYLKAPGFNITFTCNDNHEVLNLHIGHTLSLKK